MCFRIGSVAPPSLLNFIVLPQPTTSQAHSSRGRFPLELIWSSGRSLTTVWAAGVCSTDRGIDGGLSMAVWAAGVGSTAGTFGGTGGVVVFGGRDIPFNSFIVLEKRDRMVCVGGRVAWSLIEWKNLRLLCGSSYPDAGPWFHAQWCSN